jgi:hypothetical protein
MIFPVITNTDATVYVHAASHHAAALWARSVFSVESRDVLQCVNTVPAGSAEFHAPEPESYESRALEYRAHIVLACATKCREHGWEMAARMLEEEGL